MSDTFRFRSWHAAAFLAAVSGVSALSASRDVRAYWRKLNRKAKAPPAWTYRTVAIALNLLQAWADLRVLNNPEVEDREAILGLRAMNWLLYALFTPTFFRARSPIADEVVTLAEGVTNGAAVALLAKSDPLAAAVLVPLTLWTAYTGLLQTEGANSSDRLVDQLRWQGAF